VRPIPLAPNRVRRFHRGGAAIARLRGIADDEDPDDAFTRSQLGAPSGKTEAWVIADAEGRTGEVFLGFREAVPEAVLAGWVERQDTDRLLAALNRMPVAPGDAALVPHGAGPARLSGPLPAIRRLPPAQPVTAATGSRPLDAGS